MKDLIRKAEVLGLGQCSLDFLAKVEAYPGLDQKCEMDAVLVQGGGPVATALVTLSRLGVTTGFIGAVGDDEYGMRIRQGLLDEKVDCTLLTEISGARSQVAFIVADRAGHRNIFWHRGDVSPEVPIKMADILNSGVKVLHLDGLHQAAAMEAAQLARAAGVRTVLDAGTYREGINSLLPLVDHLVVSEKFALEATGQDTVVGSVVALSGHGARAVTVTSGASGSVSLDTYGDIFRQPAFEVAAVDTTGCGDVFHGGYIYGLLQDWDLQQTVRFAAACAALKTRHLGGRTAIPAREDVECFLDENKNISAVPLSC